MKAIIVCVDFDDLLEISLAKNAKHFEQILVVTAPHDKRTIFLCQKYSNVLPYVTNAFYDDGAHFNKGLAIEYALSFIGREGWLVTLDVDIILPDPLPIDTSQLDTECLHGARRRMCYNPGDYNEKDWNQYPIKVDGEIPGYFHLFHASAAVLHDQPWYGVDWTHAGGYDSVFEAKFRPNNTRWLSFEVVHLGTDGANWHGRTIPRLDARPVLNQAQHARDTETMRRLRYKNQNMDHERLIPPGDTSTP